MNKRSAMLPLAIALLGCEPREVRLKPAAPPHKDEFLPVADVQRVALGANDLCVVLRDGTVRCMRDGTLVPVPGATDVAAVAIGHHHACALTNAHGVVCWGRNELGETYGEPGLINIARKVPLPAPAAEIHVGITDSCARLATGSVLCWGAVGGTKNTPPTAIGWSSSAIGFAISESALCTVTQAHTPSCSLGGALRLNPVGEGIGVSAVALQGELGCALLDDGTVRCFALAPPSAAPDAPVPPWAQPVPIADVVQLAAGSWHTCARLRNGTVQCWGANDHGQLGNGRRTSSKEPVNVTGISDAIDLFSGGDRTCVQHATNSIECWGQDLLSDTTFGSAKPGARIPPGPNDSIVPAELRIPVAVDEPAVLFVPTAEKGTSH